ncbi:MAG: tRNA (N6-isopentenyl adenosine(37)-C2)-methylthiotransferase MiaB [Desulfobacterales bacterium]
MQPKSFYIHTIGCQMNVADSEQMAAALAPMGYGPSPALESADLVIVNTCSVRAKAEQKAFSILGRLADIKRRRPEVIVGVAGCVAQQEGEGILARAPYVDIVVGTRALHRLPAHVRRVEAERCRIVDVAMSPAAPDPPTHRAAGPVCRFVTIMRGCDNFCAYCVVPYVRGREASRPPEEILRDIGDAVEAGAREVTLLGQNVNSYGQKEGYGTFAELLARVNEIPGLLRMRFTTSHPKDLTTELMGCFAGLERLCPHIHLPVQSGSDRVLARMHRGYTREHYLDKVSKLRDTCPGIAVTSDMIVGFPGESEADFEQTLELIRKVRFDGLFAFMYSDRPNAPARQFADKVPDALSRDRLHALLALQDDITFARNTALVGSKQRVLVEGGGRRPAAAGPFEVERAQWTGRTGGNKIVHFHAGAGRVDAGSLVTVRIEKAMAHSLRGVVAEDATADRTLKGGAQDAA